MRFGEYYVLLQGAKVANPCYWAKGACSTNYFPVQTKGGVAIFQLPDFHTQGCCCAVASIVDRGSMVPVPIFELSGGQTHVGTV